MTLTTDVRPQPVSRTTAEPHTSRAIRVLVGNGAQPRWARPALLALLAATTVIYLWGLGSSGWANSYYAAAVQAGTQDWKAWLFGSLDAGNAITVDKPPAAMWVMVLSGRLFGFNAFTMPLPQALMGVGAVAVLSAAVRRCSGPGAGLIAGAVLAVTPVAALMFRYNNPDALLVLLMAVAAYFMVRATETAANRWLVLAGAVLGLAFLTKMLQAFLVVPGFALAFLVAAPVGVWRRLGKLALGAIAMVFSAGWYVALVSLWPADSRPYIGGSADNDLLQLALGYNGIERVVGGDGPGGGHGGPGGAGGNLFFGGEPGIGRLFGLSMGTEISWLLPAALIGLAAGLWFTRGTPRTGRVRVGLLLWGGWLVVTGAVFSFMGGTVHPYYTVALAPAVAALVGIATREVWRGRQFLVPRIALAAMSAATGVWAFILLDRTPDWLPALRWVVLIGSVITGAVLAVGAHRTGRATVVVAVAAMLFGTAATAAYTVDTVGRVHSGPMATSGPFGKSTSGGPGGSDGSGVGAPRARRMGQGHNAALADLVKDVDSRWAAAGIGSMTVSTLELETGASIMAIGGFSGSDNSPTLEQFQQYVADGQVRYFIAGMHGGPPGHRGGSATAISEWVGRHFTPMDIGGSTVYDLSRQLG